MIDNGRLEEIKSGLTAYVESITQPDRRAGRNFYKCPLCGSGTGRNKTGAFSITRDGKAWKCFSCGQGGDVFTLIKLHEGITDFKAQVERAAAFTGGTVNIERTDKQRKAQTYAANKAPVAGQYRNYIEACKAAAGETDYFSRRGFNADHIKRFGLGYDAAKRAIVIPYDQQGSYYSLRYIDEKRPKDRRHWKIPGIIEPLYNKAALYTEGKPCFVTEGQIDAISIIIAGGGKCGAIAIGGSGYKKLLEEVKAKKPASMLVLSFDTDDAGKKHTENTAEGLTALGVPFITASYTLDNYPEGCKDPNDFLRGNLEQLQQDIAANVEETERLANADQDQRLATHYNNNALFRLQDFADGIKANAAIDFKPTAFSELDKELDGGLYPGLYILGAISSLGKTTLMLQIADQIAAQGYDVLYFSLEMAATELMSKSISRHTFKLCQGDKSKAKTARGITTTSRYSRYSKAEKQLIDDAIAAYSEYAGNIYLYEGIGDIGVMQIKQEVAEHKKLTGNTPIVFVDYLQILAPYDMRASDKQNTDKAVLELKRLSRDYKTPVIAVSSFNRDNYANEVNMAAFKESGAIEYGSDVLLALQPQGMKPGSTANDQKHNIALVKKCKASRERSVEAVILKNRNGKTGGKVGFIYYALFNCFEQDYGFKPVEDDSDNPFTEDDVEEVI